MSDILDFDMRKLPIFWPLMVISGHFLLAYVWQKNWMTKIGKIFIWQKKSPNFLFGKKWPKWQIYFLAKKQNYQNGQKYYFRNKNDQEYDDHIMIWETEWKLAETIDQKWPKIYSEKVAKNGKK